MVESTVALVLLGCLVLFFSVNLHNILKVRTRRGEMRAYAEVERPAGFVVGLAAAGTLAYFLEVFLYLFLAFTNLLSMMEAFPFFLSLGIYAKIAGLILTLCGTAIFAWSVVVRGHYAVSWEMPENQRLVTGGPYRCVRHPSYLGYFLMFIGFSLIWPSLLTAFPLLAIPGYYHLTFEEERLLILRFGREYEEYQNRTGRFIPKL
ncbi:MAG: isoprenylcysteine carboxylmethyltransferase family protein [Candidatus Bathyarchaeota archaeon]|nr:MAG: isoprenylcysteine carboxylmethyltransferase family protein [Candidatus Bathyarchaeota archaeon]